MWIDVVSVTVRALSFIAMLQAAGAALFMVMFADALRRASCRGAINNFAFCSTLAGIVLVLSHHALEAGRMAGDFAGVMYWSLQRMTLHSSVASANLLRVTGLVLIAASIYRSNSVWRLIQCVAALFIAASFVMTGHTTIHMLRWLLAPLLMLHVLIVAFWFGSLVPLYVLVRDDGPKLASQVIASFSTLATWCVPIIAVAGGILAWLLLPSVAALLEPYGLLLLAKIIGFVVLMGLAAVNKWRLAPTLARSESATLMFRRTVLIEYVLICMVLSVTAVMTGWFSPE